MLNVTFAVDITVEGKPYKAGDSVPASEIPPGCLEVLLRQLRVSLVEGQTPLQAVPAPMLATTATEPELNRNRKNK